MRPVQRTRAWSPRPSRTVHSGGVPTRGLLPAGSTASPAYYPRRRRMGGRRRRDRRRPRRSTSVYRGQPGQAGTSRRLLREDAAASRPGPMDTPARFRHRHGHVVHEVQACKTVPPHRSVRHRDAPQETLGRQQVLGSDRGDVGASGSPRQNARRRWASGIAAGSARPARRRMSVAATSRSSAWRRPPGRRPASRSRRRSRRTTTPATPTGNRSSMPWSQPGGPRHSRSQSSSTGPSPSSPRCRGGRRRGRRPGRRRRPVPPWRAIDAGQPAEPARRGGRRAREQRVEPPPRERLARRRRVGGRDPSGRTRGRRRPSADGAPVGRASTATSRSHAVAASPPSPWTASSRTGPGPARRAGEHGGQLDGRRRRRRRATDAQHDVAGGEDGVHARRARGRRLEAPARAARPGQRVDLLDRAGRPVDERPLRPSTSTSTPGFSRPVGSNPCLIRRWSATTAGSGVRGGGGSAWWTMPTPISATNVPVSVRSAPGGDRPPTPGRQRRRTGGRLQAERRDLGRDVARVALQQHPRRRAVPQHRRRPVQPGRTPRSGSTAPLNHCSCERAAGCAGSRRRGTRACRASRRAAGRRRSR